jgi:hypothetical protein
VAEIPKINVGTSSATSIGRIQAVQSPGIKRIDGAPVTRTLPITVSAKQSGKDTSASTGLSIIKPTIDVPGVEIDYPVVDAPTQEEFDAAVNSNGGEKKSEDSGDASKAKALSNNLPLPQQLVQNQALQRDSGATTAGLNKNGLTAALPNLNPQPPTTEVGAQVTLPLLGTFPLPTKEAMALASTTAVTATMVAVLGKAGIEAGIEGIKPLLRVAAIRFKKLTSRSLTTEELQLDFAHAMEGRKNVTIKDKLANLGKFVKDNFFDVLLD